MEQKNGLLNAYYTETGKEPAAGDLPRRAGKLWELAPKWIEHVESTRKYQHAMPDLGGAELFSVTADEMGRMVLTQPERQRLEVGRQMGLKPWTGNGTG